MCGMPSRLSKDRAGDSADWTEGLFVTGVVQRIVRRVPAVAPAQPPTPIS